MHYLSDGASSQGIPLIERNALQEVPTYWPGLRINKSLDPLGPPPEFSLREISVPYTCEMLSAPILGLQVICDIEQGLTVNEEGVANVKEVAISGWTVELESINGVDRATCTRKDLSGSYQFHLEGEIELKAFKNGKALVGDMRLKGSELMRDLHKISLLSATKSVCIAGKNHDSRGREVQCLSIGGPSPLLAIPGTGADVLGQCPNCPVTIKISSHYPVNPQAATYLRYSPMKPGHANNLSIPSLGLSVDSKGEIIITQGLIVCLEAKLLISPEWKCLQDPYWVVPGIFKRIISNCEHTLHIHGSFLQDEQGESIISCTTIHLRSASFSDLEIIEGEIKSRVTPKETWINFRNSCRSLTSAQL